MDGIGTDGGVLVDTVEVVIGGLDERLLFVENRRDWR